MGQRQQQRQQRQQESRGEGRGASQNDGYCRWCDMVKVSLWYEARDDDAFLCWFNDPTIHVHPTTPTARPRPPLPRVRPLREPLRPPLRLHRGVHRRAQPLQILVVRPRAERLRARRDRRGACRAGPSLDSIDGIRRTDLRSLTHLSLVCQSKLLSGERRIRPALPLGR